MPCPSDWAAASSGGEREGSADSATSLDSPWPERFDVVVRYFCRPTPGMFLQFLRLPYFIFSFPGRSFIFLRLFLSVSYFSHLVGCPATVPFDAFSSRRAPASWLF